MYVCLLEIDLYIAIIVVYTQKHIVRIEHFREHFRSVFITSITICLGNLRPVPAAKTHSPVTLKMGQDGQDGRLRTKGREW